MTSIAPGPSNTLVYTRVVADARRAMTVSEISGVTKVSERSVQNWASGNARPEGNAREKLLELKYVIEGLSEVFEDEGIEIWLHSRQRWLGGQTPLQLLNEGRFNEVLEVIDRLAGGPKR